VKDITSASSILAQCRAILYDSIKLAVARLLGDGRRLKTWVFSELQSHYLFAERFRLTGCVAIMRPSVQGWRAAFVPLPITPFEPSAKRAVRVYPLLRL
jgi:hypothetical protein